MKVCWFLISEKRRRVLVLCTDSGKFDTAFLIKKKKLRMPRYRLYGGILADVIVYIFAHLHMALLAEGNMLDIN